MAVEGIGRLGAALPPQRFPDPAPAGERPDARPAEPRSVLTEAEAAYFIELERLGRLTYGPGARDATALPKPILGQRVDVRA